jgi:hypothetical protein
MRGSRSLASMLPALLSSGLLALVITAVTLQTQGVPHAGFFSAWMESWMIAWPIAFPIAYLARPRRHSASGLALRDIEAASMRAARKHGYKVLRGLKPAATLATNR